VRPTGKKTKAAPSGQRSAAATVPEQQQRPETRLREPEPGFGGLAEIERRTRDAQIMANLRAQLDELVKPPGAATLTRTVAVALLGVISSCLKPATNLYWGQLDTEQEWAATHPAIELLDELIDALSDLERSKTHDALRAVSGGPYRALSTAELKRDENLIVAVNYVHEQLGGSRIKAEHHVRL
jgi:hypothetical protein